MAINKKLIHFNNFSTFNSKKLSANVENTQYTIGIEGEIQSGAPEILYQSICWIKDTKQQWTHGQIYNCDSLTEEDVKTINGQSVIGEGNIQTAVAYAEYTGTSTDVVVTTVYGYFPNTLVEGARVSVKIEGSITTIKTLNVNGTGAKNVYYKGSSLTSGTINRYNTYDFIYDGSYYRIIGVDTNTDTHYTAKNVVTSSASSKANAASSNDSVYLNVVENSTVRSSHKITGSGGTSVTSDGSGNITINTSLKTINGESIIGDGNLILAGGNSDANVQAVDTNEVLDDVETNTYVKYVAQTLTEEQKAQVRANIGVESGSTGGSSSGGNGAYLEVDGSIYGSEWSLGYYEINDMQPNTFYVFPECASLWIELADETVGVANEYLFQFTSGATATTLTLPEGIKWANDAPPTIAENMIYQVSILKGLASVLEFSNAPSLIENKVTVSISGTKYLVSLQYAAASDLAVKVRTVDGAVNVNIASGQISGSANSIGPMIDSDAYIESVVPEVDSTYIYIK